MAESLSDALAGARSVLVLAPGLSEGTDAVCGTLASGFDGDPADVIAVSLTRSAAEWLSRREAYLDGDSTVRPIETGTSSHPEAATVESSEDLTGLEIALGDPLAAFEAADRPLTICVDSLTVLLQYVDLERAYRFLHDMDVRFGQAGALAHYHLDPGAHDEATLATLATLMDAAVGIETDPPGGVDERVTVDGVEVAVSVRQVPDGVAERND